MSAYRLHYFPESGNGYKLALMLSLFGQEFGPVWTDFGGERHADGAVAPTSTRWAKFRCWRTQAFVLPKPAYIAAVGDERFGAI